MSGGWKTLDIQNKKLDYRPIGRRRPGRPLKRQLEGYSGETWTGHLLEWLRASWAQEEEEEEEKKKRLCPQYIICNLV